MTATAGPAAELPRVRGHWLLGNVTAMRDDPVGTFERAHRDHGPNFALDMKVRSVVVLGHPDAVRHVLAKRPENYPCGPTDAHRAIEKIVGPGLLTTDGAAWSRLRKGQQPAFQPRRLAPLVGTIVAHTSDALDRWATVSERGEELDAFTTFMGLALTIGIDALFDYRLSSVEADQVSDALISGHERMWANLFRPIPMPALFDRRAARGVRALHALADRVLAADRSNESARLIAEMARLDGAGRAELRSQILTYIVSVGENPANTLSWSLAFIANRPDVEARIVEEIDRVLGDRDPSIDDVARLEYTERVIDETLRMIPGGWLLDRYSLSDDVVMGMHIPARHEVIASPYLVHRHPEFWPEPERFDPDRFLPDRARARPVQAYLPFGAGPHACIGSRLAQLELKIMLPMLLRRFRFAIASPQPVRPWAGFILRPRELRFRLTKRPW